MFVFSGIGEVPGTKCHPDKDSKLDENKSRQEKEIQNKSAELENNKYPTREKFELYSNTSTELDNLANDPQENKKESPEETQTQQAQIPVQETEQTNVMCTEFNDKNKHKKVQDAQHEEKETSKNEASDSVATNKTTE